MNALARFSWRAAVLGRWLARLVGILLVLFMGAFVLGTESPSLARMSGRELLYSLGLLMLFLGLFAAWRWPLAGGLASLLGWSLLSALSAKPLTELLFLLPVATALLHIFCWARLRGAPAPPFRWSGAWIGLAALVGVFVLLSANEMFGQPPLLSPRLKIGPELSGTWEADVPADFTIAPDGRVTGTVANVVIQNGEIISNRSWFGQLLGWRTDYMIRGRLASPVELSSGPAGDRFTAPLNSHGPLLRGSLFLSHSGRPIPTRLVLQRR